MPQTYNCDICHEVAADYMITEIQTGQTIAVGVECVLDWSMPLAEAFNEAVEASQRHEEPATAPVTAEDQQWEEDYPQGRQDPDGEPPGDDTEVGGSDSEEESPADVGG